VLVIGKHRLGRDAPCFVIAEAGVNHNGDPELAGRLIDAAADAGADAVKFQTFRASSVAAAEAPKADYQLETTGNVTSQREMLEALELDEAAHRELKRHAGQRGLAFLSTPFDAGSVALLDDLDVDAFKVASPDLTNYPLLDEIAICRRPIFLSTGLADLEEVGAGIERLRTGGATEVVLLQCTSAYPAPANESNLRAMATMANRFGLPVGYSDHTEGSEVALAAVALGAATLEKHLTLDRAMPGPDHRASLEPDELADLIRAVRRVESALGNGIKTPSPAEARNTAVVRRSLAAAADLPAGATLTRAMLIALRPGTGISPTQVDEVAGRRLKVDKRQGEILQSDDLQ
jgi:N-acetylneuraminate synthase/N,N'-diacetyllegionaminate synthase